MHKHLVAQDVAAGLYHGGLHAAVREATQAAFMDGRYRVVVATKAFGMGIDKPDTRFVVHYQVPDSIESYVQEAGRAGRDGADARCMLIFDPNDVAVQRFFLSHKQPPALAVRNFIDWLSSSQEGQPGAAQRWRQVIASDIATLSPSPGKKVTLGDQRRARPHGQGAEGAATRGPEGVRRRDQGIILPVPGPPDPRKHVFGGRQRQRSGRNGEATSADASSTVPPTRGGCALT